MTQDPKEKGGTVLVIGGGIAGIQASLDLADEGFKVYLVERTPSIGGRMAQLDKTFPTLDCSICMLAPKMIDCYRHPKINLLTYSEVKAVEGSVGNFIVHLTEKARYVRMDRCTGCGQCAEKCPVKVPSEFNMGLGTRKAIYIPFQDAMPHAYTIDSRSCRRCGKCEETCPEDAVDLTQKPMTVELRVGTIIVATGGDIFDATQKKEYGYGMYPNVINNLQLERLLDPSGPSGGKFVRPSDGKTPRSIAFIQCVGSRDNEVGNPYCSRYCCAATLNQAKEIAPNADVIVFYTDIRSFGKGCEELYRVVRGLGTVIFVRGEVSEVVGEPTTGNLIVKASDDVLGEPVEAEVDMVVLSTGLVPSEGAEEVARKLSIVRGPDGFFLEAHPKLRPLDTATDGVYLAGVAQGPKDVTDSISQGSGAASRASIPMVLGRVEIESIFASVNEELCSGCGVCEMLCPYGSVKVEAVEGAKRLSRVTEALCKGCGTCAASCPSGAITMRHFSDGQILAEIRALVP